MAPWIKRDVSGEIIREVAKETGAAIEEVFSIVNCQSKYVAWVIEHSGFETVTLPYLGKFVVNPKRVQKLNQAMTQKLVHGNIQRGKSPDSN
jgi:hypothetical protein